MSEVEVLGMPSMSYQDALYYLEYETPTTFDPRLSWAAHKVAIECLREKVQSMEKGKEKVKDI